MKYFGNSLINGTPSYLLKYLPEAKKAKNEELVNNINDAFID